MKLKTGLKFNLLFILFTISYAVLADGAPNDESVTPDFLAFLIASFNGIRGASIWGALGVVVQVILKALDQPFANRFFGKPRGLSRLALVAALTFIVTPIGLISGAGLTLGAAMAHSATLTAFMVFINQIYQQAIAQKGQAS